MDAEDLRRRRLMLLRQAREEIDLALRQAEVSEDLPPQHFPLSCFVPELLLGMQAELLERLSALQEARNGCPLRQGGPDSLQFLVAPGGRSEGLKEIRDFTYQAESLTIVDPYLYSGANCDAEHRAQELLKNGRLSSPTLRALHLVTNASYGSNKSIRRHIREAASKHHCQFSERRSDKIHDRIWIRDGREAIVVGTSFGGIGNRLAFILPLPQHDLNALMEFLRSEGLL